MTYCFSLAFTLQTYRVQYTLLHERPLYNYFSVPFCFSLRFSPSISLSPFLSLYFSFSVPFFLYLSFSVSLSLCLSAFISHSLSLYIFLSLFLSPSFSPSLPHLSFSQEEGYENVKKLQKRWTRFEFNKNVSNRLFINLDNVYLKEKRL